MSAAFAAAGALVALACVLAAPATAPAPAAPALPAAPVAAAADTTVVLVVRHAERASREPNGDLSAAGLARADAVAALARDAGVQAIYTTDFCRTAQTAQPAAQSLGIGLRVLATGSAAAGLDACSPHIAVPFEVTSESSADGIARRVLAEQPGRVVLVVGHSNTVPAIAEALGAHVCPDVLPLDDQDRCWLADDRFDAVLVVRVPRDGGPVRIELRTVAAGADLRSAA